MSSLLNTKLLGPRSIPLATPTGAGKKLDETKVLGFNVVNAKMAETVYWIADRAQARQPTQIAFLNAHCANVARKDWRYRDTLENVEALLPDGSGVAMAAKLNGAPLGDNLNGTDLFGRLCRCLAFRKIPVFFLGGRPGVAQQAAENTKAEIPLLNIAGHRHGYFSPREEQDVIDEINASGARVVFVAFGVPDQDVWISRIRHRLHAPVILGVGGLLDFVSGRIPRAPLWMRKAGLEWMYRLKCEPKRMWRRYTIGNISFTAHALASAMAGRRKSVSQICRPVFHPRPGYRRCGPRADVSFTSPASDGGDDPSGKPRNCALFRQTRIGENGKPFMMYKFRSMRNDGPSQAELSKMPDDRNDGVTFKLKSDPRITRIGKFIRKASIDELPQLWNVLKGDMSLVGPRPALPVEVEKYSRVERRRLNGKPGITCLWQIEGRANIPFDKQVVLDVTYLQKRSIWMDLVILARTPMAVITARGAY